MDPFPLKSWTVAIAEDDWQTLAQHHFQGAMDEHGSVLVCGVAESDRERRLLVREVLLAKDGADYVESRSAYRALSASFVSEKVGHCAREKLVYLAVHNHFGTNAVAFSPIDMRSHERGYPALLDITNGGPVGALVLAQEAVAGDVWEQNGRAVVVRTVILGARRRVLGPEALDAPERASENFEGQVRLFGDAGQALLKGLKVGIVGAGGAGSMLTQVLAHLGIGELAVVEYDLMEDVNAPRQVGSFPSDVVAGTPKVDMARRMALAINPSLKFHRVKGNVVDLSSARELLDCDALFLAADSMQARHVFNAICFQYMIPGFQVGAKATAKDGTVTDAFAVSRIVGPSGLCMWCSGLIDPHRLALEAYPEAERTKIEYVPSVRQPSVITMNAMSTALALNDFLFMFTGLHEAGVGLGPRRYHFMAREMAHEVLTPRRPDCPECNGRRARGERADLPLRLVDL